ncbi:hypothetical protein [Alteromonas sp. AMM-1]|uniref:hypothetical protein n=1 Tax=Alteromonas sp. AMM-1 TaxID=3394233 RepID=UPI0039A4BF05
MKELTHEQIQEVSGAGILEVIDETLYQVGYSVGYSIGYFYSNVMVGNGIVDDLANTLGE